MAGVNNGEHVTRRPRRWEKAFLAKLRNTSNVRASCEDAGIGRTEVYDHRKNDPVFAALWDAALEEAIDLLEAKAWTNAMKKDSETSLWNLLKAHRPDKYREQMRVNINITGIAERIADEFGLPMPDVVAMADSILEGQAQRKSGE